MYFALHVKMDALSLGDVKASWSRPINMLSCDVSASSGVEDK